MAEQETWPHTYLHIYAKVNMHIKSDCNLKSIYLKWFAQESFSQLERESLRGVEVEVGDAGQSEKANTHPVWYPVCSSFLLTIKCA